MSRIGRAPIQIPQGVQVTINDHLVTVAGPLGTLSQVIDKSIDVKVEDGHVLCTRHSDDKDHRALHGLYRALIHNMVVGVTDVVAPDGITFAQPQPLEIVVKGIDRQLVGQTAATIRAYKPVEPYHGYGIHYKDETVIHKVGKRATK